MTLLPRIALWFVLCAPALAAQVLGVAAIGVTVRDLERSIPFYCDVLGFELQRVVDREGESLERITGVFGARARIATLRLGKETLELTQFLAPEGRAVPETWRACDQWFQHVAIVVRDMDEAYAALSAARVRHVSPSPQTLPMRNPNAGGIRAFYFKDPDGHALEIIWFPEGKGNRRWREPTDRLFLGIDHTTIVVRDTDRALGFYRDTLGLSIVGESRNHGVEQERLNNVFGASLRITALRAPRGPGIELLEYLAPTDCDPFPADARANDLLHWQIVVHTDNAEGMAQEARAVGARWISPGAAPDAWHGKPGAMFRDPDGHTLLALLAPEAATTTSTMGDNVR